MKNKEKKEKNNDLQRERERERERALIRVSNLTGSTPYKFEPFSESGPVVLHW